MIFEKIEKENYEAFRVLNPTYGELLDLYIEAGLPVYFCKTEGFLHTETEEFNALLKSGEIKIKKSTIEVPKTRKEFLAFYSPAIMKAKKEGNATLLESFKKQMESLCQN